MRTVAPLKTVFPVRYELYICIMYINFSFETVGWGVIDFCIDDSQLMGVALSL